MFKYILDRSSNNVRHMGEKANILNKLLGLDINVPKFFCISSELLDSILLDNNISVKGLLDSICSKDENSIKSTSNKIRTALAESKIPKAFEAELYEYIDKHFKNTKLFSVRSSSMVEDNAAHSFAGQFDTYLNVEKSDVLKSISYCFASLYSESSLQYAALGEINFNEYNMGVIVQEMINPDTSGVVFTSNPQGIINEAVIVSGKGDGSNVVSDKVPVTTYYYNKTDCNYYYETNGQSPILSNHLIDELMNISLKIQGGFGDYIDIEYAVKDNEIYILQARPITTIDDSKLTILDNSNIVESYPGVTLPLTSSFIEDAYEGVFKNVAYLITKNSKLINCYDDVFKNMLGTVNGRVYYKISNWYTLIKFLPFSKKLIPIWQDMMGVKDKSFSNDDVKISFLETIKTYVNFFFELIRTPKSMTKLETCFNDAQKLFTQVYQEKPGREELYKLYQELRKKIFSNWGVTLLNDTYAFIYTGLLKGIYRKSGNPDYEEKVQKKISGISNIESIKPVKELIRISNLALSQNQIDDLKALKSNDDVIAFLSVSGTLQAEISHYIERYGDRCLEELKLETKTFRASPILLIQKILEYAYDPAKLSKLTEAFSSNQNIDSQIKFGFFKKRFVDFLSKRATLGIKNREISRLNRSRLYGMVRSIFLEIANILQADGLIDYAEDIFYLQTNEVFACIQNQSVDLKNTISARKREFDVYNKLPCYSRLVFAGNEWNKQHQNVNSTYFNESLNQIFGTACSGGIATGEVVVINNPNDVKNIKDKILVTKMTDPGWVFLLAMAKGVISEKGSLLSHTAIISRELKIPAIVGVDNITKLLKTGDIVEMNGNTGLIRKVNNKNV